MDYINFRDKYININILVAGELPDMITGKILKPIKMLNVPILKENYYM